jgi:hypothetical protein
VPRFEATCFASSKSINQEYLMFWISSTYRLTFFVPPSSVSLELWRTLLLSSIHWRT